MRTVRLPVTCLLIACAVLLSGPAFAQSIPKPLRTRFVIGDPIWRELPVRKEIEGQYDRVWQTVVDTLLDAKFDLATMDKDAGYARSTWKEGVIQLSGDWYYKVQVSVKLALAYTDGTTPSQKAPVAKVRIQVMGELTNVTNKGLKYYYRGYDQVILQNLFQDLQSKLGSA